MTIASNPQSPPGPAAESSPGLTPAPYARSVVFVANHGFLRDWCEKRLYEPLVGKFNIDAIFWDRGSFIGPDGWEEAERYGIRCREYKNPHWNLRELFDYYGYIIQALDQIQADRGIDYVVACDTDVMIPMLWHRLTRRKRYKVYRNEIDYYSGSRWRFHSFKHRVMRFLFDALEAVLHTQCDVVFTLNRHAKARIVKWGIPAKKVLITGLWKKDVYYESDHEAYKRRLLERGVLTPEQYERLAGRVVVAFFGLFYEFTHLWELLDVAARYPDHFAVLLAGRGRDLPTVQDYALRFPNIMYLGWKTEDELHELYKITDIVYQPLNPEENINWKYFGSTNKTFESVAAGTLFIGSAINERVDMNNEAEWALLLDFNRDLRHQIDALFRSIMADRDVLRRYQANARKLFERYNHDAHAKIWLTLFRESA